MRFGGMGSSSENCCCVVCEFSIDVSSTLTPVRTIEYITEISGRPVKDLLGGLFTQDYELLVKLEKRPKRNSPLRVSIKLKPKQNPPLPF